MYKSILIILLVLIGFLQFRLWKGEGSVQDIYRLTQIIHSQSKEIEQLTDRNQRLDAEVSALKSNPMAFEERARSELGMIKEGETFYVVVDPSK
jgi:cell division protein FtsB